ncbi:MAG: hypothetical protein Q7S02_02145 [bacterium]|nr:hypothetical protein [bacterium]
MDRQFKQMLEEAERVRVECRATGDIGPHAACMAQMIQYGQQRGLFTGDVLTGTASEENLANAAEGGACILEVIHGAEAIGSVLDLPRDQQIALCRRAMERAEAHIRSLGR